MALDKSRGSVRDTKPDRATRATEEDSTYSFGGDVQDAKPAVRYAWAVGSEKVNHESFHRMLEEYRDAKKREMALQLKTKQLTAQLARTEEAAKRALVESDATARGGAAQKLLDAERALSKLRDENAELRSKLAREKKRATDLKQAYDDTKKRLDGVLKDQRLMVRKVGDLERKNTFLNRKPEDDYWGEEAGRRFAQQQEELVALREENMRLHQALNSGEFGLGGGGGQPGQPPSSQHQDEMSALKAQVDELSALVNFYERKMATLAEQHIIPAQEGLGQGPSPDDWILEEHYHNDQMYLLDRKTSKLFTVATQTSWPRPVGIRTGTQVRLGSNSPMERFINTLDNYLQSNQSQLLAVFKEFDLDGSGQLDRRELARLVKRLMPELTDSRQVEELGAMLDMDGDGQVSYEELLGTIKEAFTARMAAKSGKSTEINTQLERVRDVLRDQKKLAREAFDALDTDHDGCLHHLDVIRMIKGFIKDLTQKEVRYLLAKLQEWDVTGEGKTTYQELLQALELVKIYRVSQGMGGMAQPISPGRASPGRPGAGPGPGGFSVGAKAAGAAARQSSGQALKEGFLRERLVQLEAELHSATKRESALEADAGKIDVLRRDLALARARIEDLEKDYSRLDVVFRLDQAAMSGDQQLHAAWEAAAQFKKRYMEHKAELDAIRLAAARMQAQLDETHKLLHGEHKKRFALEDDVSRLNMELQRVKDLETRLGLERGERVKLEREYLNLQSKALSAPGSALGEVRQLREEIFALRRDKALAEQKEVEVRRELSHVREQLDGMSIDQYRAWQREYHDLKKKVTTLALELQAANDKLDVYRRTDTPGTAGIVFGDKEAPSFLDRRPDVDKNEDQIRREIAQLREVWHADQLELKKLHHVLEAESNQTLEAKAALEEAHREMDRLRRDWQDQIRSLQRELDRRDERVRKLELQLRGAYSGINRALRSSKLRDSRAIDSPDDLSELGDDQNILELHISEATLYEEVLGKDPSTFFTFDFFMHDTQATPVLSSNTPTYDTIVQYIVDSDTFLMQYLDTHVLELELNRARGWDYDPIGVARVPLRQVLEDVEIGAALGHNRAYHYVDVYGADGKRVGRVRYGFTFRRPLDNLIRDYRKSSRSTRGATQELDARDPAVGAVVMAEGTPASASHVKVIVARCESLVAPSAAGTNSRPYVWFRFPGHRGPHTTRMLYGANPVFNDESNWLLARTPDLENNLRTREMEFVVFDDAGGEDPLRGIIGVAFVPLAALAQGVPVEGAFKLINPVSKQPAGKIILGMGWHNPLSLPTAKPQPATTIGRAPAVAYGAAGGSPGRAPPNLPHSPPRHDVPQHTGLGSDISSAQPLGSMLPQFPPRQQSPPAPPAASGIGLPQFPQRQGSPPGTATELPAFPARQQFGLGAEVAAAGPGVPGGAGVTPARPGSSAGRFVPPRVPHDRFDIVTGQQQPQPTQQPPQGVYGHYGQQQPVAPSGGVYRPQGEPSLGGGPVPPGYGQQPQPGYGLAAESQTPPAHMLLAPGVQQGAGRQRYSEVERSASPPPLKPVSAFSLLSADRALWPPQDTHLILCLDTVQLDAPQLVAQGYSYIFIMHALLESCVGRLETGPLQLSYASSYRVVPGPQGDVTGTNANTELINRLRDGTSAYLDLRLYASRSNVLDLSQIQRGGIKSLAVAEVSLGDIAAGRQMDLIRTQVPLVTEDTHQRVGVVSMTFLASTAVRLAQQVAQQAAVPGALVPGYVGGVSSSMQDGYIGGYPLGYY